MGLTVLFTENGSSTISPEDGSRSSFRNLQLLLDIKPQKKYRNPITITKPIIW
jgi:hypothetical protein